MNLRIAISAKRNKIEEYLRGGDWESWKEMGMRD